MYFGNTFLYNLATDNHMLSPNSTVKTHEPKVPVVQIQSFANIISVHNNRIIIVCAHMLSLACAVALSHLCKNLVLDIVLEQSITETKLFGLIKE